MAFKLQPKAKETLTDALKDLKVLTIVLENALDEEKSLSDISRSLDITPQQMQTLMKRYFKPSQFKKLTDLDRAAIIKKYQTPMERCLTDVIGANDNNIISLSEDEEARMLNIMKTTLNPREYDVMTKYYGVDDNMQRGTYDSVASELRLTRERIRQIIAKSLRKMRHPDRLGPILISDYHEQYTNAVNKARQEIQEMNKNRLNSQIKKITGYVTYNNDPLPANMSVRTHNCLTRGGITTLNQIFEKSEIDFLKLRNLGRNSLEEIKELFKQYDIPWKEQ